MAKKELPPAIPLVDKFSYRLDDSKWGELDITLYEGNTKVGRIIMAPQQNVQRHCAELLTRLGAPVEPVSGLSVRVPARIWCAVDSTVAASKRGKGYGRLLYEVGMWVAYQYPIFDYLAEKSLPPGPYYFIPDECGTSAQTSPEAHRVWKSLRRDWPAAYGVIRNVLMYRDIEVTVLYVDREPELHLPKGKR